MPCRASPDLRMYCHRSHLPRAPNLAKNFALSLAFVIAASPATIDRVTQIRGLTPSEAARGLPVKLRGIVTHYDPSQPDLFLQDATGGIYVACQKPLNIQQGQNVEVAGVSGAGEFAPVIENPQVRIL